MPGLLDLTDDPQQMGLLSLGLRLMSTPGKFGTALGQAGLGALGDLQQARSVLEARKLREQQMKFQQAQEQRAAAAEQRLAALAPLQQEAAVLQLRQAQEAERLAQEERERADAFRKSIPSPQGQALQALGANASPTLDNAARLAPVDPRSQFLYNALQAGQLKPMEYLTATQKDQTPIKVGAGEALVDPRTYRPVFTNPKEDANPAEWRLYQLSGAPQRNITFDQWDQARKRAAATNVTVQPDNLGLKPKDRFEMEQKLAADFNAATKTDRGIVSVSADLTNILKQPGAIKDQAAIYKFAKFLDPDGAVREADYAAIVKTAGGLDYVKSLINKALTGEQLTDNQRNQMDSLVRSMAGVAQKRMDAVKQRFAANARMYNLTPDNIFQLGAEDVPGLSLQDAAAAELARRQRRN